jgi:hypothetical protein
MSVTDGDLVDRMAKKHSVSPAAVQVVLAALRSGGGGMAQFSHADFRSQRPWNKGLLIGQKKPLEPKHVWSIRVRLEIARSRRDLAICGVGQRSCKRRKDDRSSLRSRNSPEIPSKRGYHCSGPPALDTSSQADFMPALTYQPANMRGWCIDGSRASAWRQPLMARTRCGVRRLPRFIERPVTYAR